MLKPVQRFPQFLLVLQDLLNNTSFDHADRVNIESAVTTLDKLTEQLDQRREFQVIFRYTSPLFFAIFENTEIDQIPLFSVKIRRKNEPVSRTER